MTKTELSRIVEVARCQVIGWEDAGNAGHRLTLAMLIRAFNNSESALLCEPSLAARVVRGADRPPDIVLIDPEIGVHVVEVKSISLEQIESVNAGGHMAIRYGSRLRNHSPAVQARTAMFDIKHATIHAFGGEVQIRFDFWVAFPLIKRTSWMGRFGEEGYCANNFLFLEDVLDPRLAARVGSSDRVNSTSPIRTCPLEQMNCVWRAFGDTSVLYCEPNQRPSRQVKTGTLGEQFDAAAESYKNLSSEQQDLSAADWDGAPRLIRGVAGSGKTIVLANNLARNLERRLAAGEELFGEKTRPPRLLAVCFNRTLAPQIQKKINIAFQQRNGRPVPKGAVDVLYLNALMYELANSGLVRYQSVESVQDIVRALNYVTELEQFKQRDPGRVRELGYDAIYVDEGQDFFQEEFRFLKELCRVNDGAEPNLYVFYDDAQNLYGRRRPNWQSMGLNVRGRRAFVMSQCFRNTRSIVEAAFNVLYGTCSTRPGQVPTKEFGDITSLGEKGLIVNDGGFWRIKFARREGSRPRVCFTPSQQRETESIIERLRWLVGPQEVRPEDILVMSQTRDRIEGLANAIESAKIPGIEAVHRAFKEKDQPLGQKDRLTLSTVASAKGYDAYCVLLASANAFGTDVKGRASFYVGCTRAMEYLEVFAHQKTGLAIEMDAAIAKLPS